MDLDFWECFGRRKDGSRFLGMFQKKKKKHLIAELPKTDLNICGHFRMGKHHLIAV